jgi:hypothetical protein
MPDQVKSLMGAKLRDLKLLACIEFANTSWKTPEIKTPEFDLVLNVFRYNFSRVRTMMTMPSQFCEMAMKIQKFLDLAKFEITGRVDGGGFSDPVPSAVATKFEELWKAEYDREAKFLGTPEWDARVLRAHKRGLDPVIILGNSGPAVGFHTMFSSYITATWTAIEAMAADLWEAALNAHPAGLSNLSGKSNRLRQTNKPSGFSPRTVESGPKLVPLSFIQMHHFDVRQKMGTILRERFEFGRLDGIREAYASAFHEKSTQIDAALSNNALDSLSAVRNVIVHRAAIADAEYLKRAKRLKVPIPPAGIGAQVPLDGQVVVELIAPAISCASKLIGAVDDWIVQRSGPKDQPT